MDPVDRGKSSGGRSRTALQKLLRLAVAALVLACWGFTEWMLFAVAGLVETLSGSLFVSGMALIALAGFLYPDPTKQPD